METTAKVDLRKLQLLNDRINQTIEALNQLRMSVHGLQHASIGAGAPGVGVGQNVGFGGGVDPRLLAMMTGGLGPQQLGQFQQPYGQQGLFGQQGVPGMFGQLAHTPFGGQTPYGMPSPYGVQSMQGGQNVQGINQVPGIGGQMPGIGGQVPWNQLQQGTGSQIPFTGISHTSPGSMGSVGGIGGGGEVDPYGTIRAAQIFPNLFSPVNPLPF